MAPPLQPPATEQEVALVTKALSIPSGYAQLRLGMDNLHPTQVKILNSIFRDKQVSFLAGNGTGKALWIGTPILTSAGWKTMEDIKVGDKIYGSDGKLCNVIFSTDIMYDRPCNMVKFSDGSSIIADDEHLWKTYYTQPSRHNPDWYKNKQYRTIFDKSYVVMNTKQIKETLKYKFKKRNINAHQIRLCAPLQYDKKDLPISPYLLGSWLGDGSSCCGVITYHGNKKEIIDNIIKDGYIIQNDRKDKRNEVHCATIKGLFRTLRLNNLLNNKHIPQIYMESSVEQRLELLRGLLDTDGSADKGGYSAEFYNTNEKLAYQVYELCLGLGLRATIRKKEAKLYGRFISFCWTIVFPTREVPFNVFKLSCKLNRILHDDKPKKDTTYYLGGRMITDISSISSVGVKCIQVDSLDKCFLAGKELIITHNTSIVLVASILYALEILNAQVVSTSATYRQITSQLIPCLKKYSSLYHPNWEFLDNTVVINKEKRYIGFSAEGEGSYQGYHAYPDKPLYIVVDEAAGVRDDIFRAIERCKPTYYLVTGSPLSPEGEFYNIEAKPEIYKQFKHFKLTQPECWWIKKEDIAKSIERWGVDHPLIRSMVYAEFSSNIEGGIVSLSQYQKCIDANLPHISGTRVVALDFAAGGDSNVIAYRDGNKIEIVDVWKDRDTMSAAGRFLLRLNKLKELYGILPHNVYGDASGLGKPICDRLKELGWNINNFYGQTAANNEEHYRNSIAECWLELSNAINHCTVILPRNDELMAQLLSRKQRLNSSGKMELESKKDMKARGIIVSPDLADAVAMCFGKGNAGDVKYISVVPWSLTSGYSM